jgi:hypothetical protein
MAYHFDSWRKPQCHPIFLFGFSHLVTETDKTTFSAKQPTALFLPIPFIGSHYDHLIIVGLGDALAAKRGASVRVRQFKFTWRATPPPIRSSSSIEGV